MEYRKSLDCDKPHRTAEKVHIAIVRRQSHLARACQVMDHSQMHFLCLSLDVFVAGLARGLSVGLPADYESVCGHDFSVEGNRLAMEWIQDRLAQTVSVSAEMQSYLATRYAFFFATALFARELIQAVVMEHSPRKVYLWRDERRPIIGDWPAGSGEGSVFAEVAAECLSGQSIGVEFLEDTSAVMVPLTANYMHPLRQSLPRPLAALLRPLYRTCRRLGRKTRALCLRGHVALGKWIRIPRHRTTILLWGDAVDAVYQAELQVQWRRERSWRILRIESRDPTARIARSHTRNGQLPFGLPMDLAIEAFGARSVPTTARRDDRPEPGQVASGGSDRDPFSNNPNLTYQYQAMVRDARFLEERIRSLDVLLSNMLPDCVVTHLDSSLAIAARRAGIPSVVVAHGGIFAPEFVAMQGDVNVVSGELQKQFCGGFNGDFSRFVVAGLPQIPTARRSVIESRRYPCTRPSVVFLVTDSDYYCWDATNLRLFLAALTKIRELAEANHFYLTVKLHPRYGQEALYAGLLKADGKRIRLDTTPRLGDILARADVAIVCGLTTAIIEAIENRVPTVAFFNHSQPPLKETPYHRGLRDALRHASDVEDLGSILLELIRSERARATALRRQESILPKLLAAAGSEAARRVADICQELVDRRIRPFGQA